MTPECERFEVEIGMRQHGALDAAEERALDAHLATCDSCRAFAASSGGFEDALKLQAAREVAEVQWERLHAGVRRLSRNYRLKLWLAPLFILQVPLIFILALHQLPPRELLLASPLTVLLYAGWVWLVNRPFREVLAVVKNGSDLVEGYARHLRRQRKISIGFALSNLGFTLFGVVATVTQPELRGAGVFIALFFANWAAYDLFYKLPRLRRALAEVGR